MNQIIHNLLFVIVLGQDNHTSRSTKLKVQDRCIEFCNHSEIRQVYRVHDFVRSDVKTPYGLLKGTTHGKHKFIPEILALKFPCGQLPVHVYLPYCMR